MASPIINVLEVCRVSPPPGAAVEKSLPLTYFDIIWLPFGPMSRVIFYDFPHSTPHFTQNVVPILKTSLSLVLEHFSPFAGNLINPIDINSSTSLHVRYLDSDPVSVTFVECTSNDYIRLSGKHARDFDELTCLVPQLPPAVRMENCDVVPVLAVQVTTFPNNGISIGITHSHVVADGTTMFNFIQSWASIAKQLIRGDNKDDDNAYLQLQQLPFYDRSVIKDPYGLYSIFRKSIEADPENIRQIYYQQATTKKYQATFVINQVEIQSLKKIVLNKLPTLAHISSFTVVCAYLWTCVTKTRVATDQKADETLHFSCMMNCRSRLVPPISDTYFGNCTAACIMTAKSSELIGEAGLFTAAELIGEEIYKKANNADLLFANMEGFSGAEYMIGIAGSPKFDYYNCVDFGWGKAKKFEFVSEPLWISRCKDSESDLEIGICLPKKEMDVFCSIFAKGISDLCF